MHTQQISTVLMVDDIAASLAFYEKQLGFERTFQIAWFASLRHPHAHAAIDLWQRSHPSVPAAAAHAPRGVLLALVVEDAEAELQRMRASGVPVLHELRDEPWGQRHFMVADPSGCAIDIVQRTQPTQQFLVENGLA